MVSFSHALLQQRAIDATIHDAKSPKNKMYSPSMHIHIPTCSCSGTCTCTCICPFLSFPCRPPPSSSGTTAGSCLAFVRRGFLHLLAFFIPPLLKLLLLLNFLQASLSCCISYTDLLGLLLVKYVGQRSIVCQTLTACCCSLVADA